MLNSDEMGLLQTMYDMMRPNAHVCGDRVVIASEWWVNNGDDQIKWHEPKESSILSALKSLDPSAPLASRVERITIMSTRWPLLLLRVMQRKRKAALEPGGFLRKQQNRMRSRARRAAETPQARQARKVANRNTNRRLRLARRQAAAQAAQAAAQAAAAAAAPEVD